MSSATPGRSSTPVRIKADAVAHDERTIRNTELEELRKKKIAKKFQKQTTNFIQENLMKQELYEKIKSSRNLGSEASFPSNKSDSAGVYVRDSWAMQQKALAELERKKRQEAESFLRGYKPSSTGLAFSEKEDKMATHDYVSRHGGELDNFVLTQRAMAAKERQKRLEAESYLRNYKYIAPANEKSANGIAQPEAVFLHPSWEDDDNKTHDTPVPSKKGISSFFPFTSNPLWKNKKQDDAETSDGTIESENLFPVSAPAGEDDFSSPSSVISTDISSDSRIRLEPTIEDFRTSNAVQIDFDKENENSENGINTPMMTLRKEKNSIDKKIVIKPTMILRNGEESVEVNLNAKAPLIVAKSRGEESLHINSETEQIMVKMPLEEKLVNSSTESKVGQATGDERENGETHSSSHNEDEISEMDSALVRMNILKKLEETTTFKSHSNPLRAKKGAKGARCNWKLDLFMSFEPNKDASNNYTSTTVAEKWGITLIFTINFSSQRMNEVSLLQSGNIRDKFERKFGDVGVTLIKNVLEECSCEHLSYEISTFSARAINESVIATFQNKEPIKILVQTDLNVIRRKDTDVQKLKDTISTGFRTAITRGASTILADMS